MTKPDSFTDCKNIDLEAYAFFSCQYFQAMAEYGNTASGDPPYWFGRLLAFGYTTENLFAGTILSEKDLRTALEQKQIVLHNYSLKNVKYTLDPKNNDLAQVTGTVQITISHNGGNAQTFDKEFTHFLKKSWVADKTIFS